MYLNETLKEIVGEPALRALVVKADPFTRDIHGLIAWLEQQPGEIEYNYNCLRGCLLAQFAKAAGITEISWWRSLPCCGGLYNTDSTWEDQISSPLPWTVNAALSRARALRDAT